MNYVKSRDLAWQVLIDNKINKMPINLGEICKNMEIKLRKYSKCSVSRQFNGDGVTIIYKGDTMILYNDNCSIGRSRFTIAHELGHILLGHLEKGQISLVNKEPNLNDHPIETEANIFASRILAPACVLWEKKVKTAEDIAILCNISIQSATFRLKRMQEIYKREEELLNQGKGSCFLKSNLEKQVYNNFFSK